MLIEPEDVVAAEAARTQMGELPRVAHCCANVAAPMLVRGAARE